MTYSDALVFFIGGNPPLAMMGVALNRYLPGAGAMLANEAYVFICANEICDLFYHFDGNYVLQVTVLCVQLFCCFDLLC